MPVEVNWKDPASGACTHSLGAWPGLQSHSHHGDGGGPRLGNDRFASLSSQHVSGSILLHNYATSCCQSDQESRLLVMLIAAPTHSTPTTAWKGTLALAYLQYRQYLAVHFRTAALLQAR